MAVDPHAHPAAAPTRRRAPRRGGFVIGLVVGLLVGLAVALGVALYITKAPVPFVDKVPQRTAEHDRAEAERNRNWDPNAALGGRTTPRPALAGASAATGVGQLPAPDTPASAAVPGTPPANLPATPPATPGLGKPAAAGAASAARPARDPAAILSGAAVPSPAAVADNFVFFVQAGAFTRNEDAEQQKARLALLGQTARISEREQSGRLVYRVRVGPFPQRDEADALQQRLTDNGIESQIVRVEKQP
jgi:cell division protein FtsN